MSLRGTDGTFEAVSIRTFTEFKELFQKQSVKTVKGYYDAYVAELFTYLGQDKKKYLEKSQTAARFASMLAEELKTRGKQYVH